MSPTTDGSVIDLATAWWISPNKVQSFQVHLAKVGMTIGVGPLTGTIDGASLDGVSLPKMMTLGVLGGSQIQFNGEAAIHFALSLEILLQGRVSLANGAPTYYKKAGSAENTWGTDWPVLGLPGKSTSYGRFVDFGHYELQQFPHYYGLVVPGSINGRLTENECRNVLAKRAAVFVWTHMLALEPSSLSELMNQNTLAFTSQVDPKIGVPKPYSNFWNIDINLATRIVNFSKLLGQLCPWLSPTVAAKIEFKSLQTLFTFKSVSDQQVARPNFGHPRNKLQFFNEDALPPADGSKSPFLWSQWLNMPTPPTSGGAAALANWAFSEEHVQLFYLDATATGPDPLRRFHTGWLWDTNPISALRLLLTSIGDLPPQYVLWLAQKQKAGANTVIAQLPYLLVTRFLANVAPKGIPLDMYAPQQSSSTWYASWGLPAGATDPTWYAQSGNESPTWTGGAGAPCRVPNLSTAFGSAILNRAQLAQLALRVLHAAGVPAYMRAAKSAVYQGDVDSGYSLTSLGSIDYPNAYYSYPVSPPNSYSVNPPNQPAGPVWPSQDRFLIKHQVPLWGGSYTQRLTGSSGEIGATVNAQLQPRAPKLIQRSIRC